LRFGVEQQQSPDGVELLQQRCRLLLVLVQNHSALLLQGFALEGSLLQVCAARQGAGFSSRIAGFSVEVFE
jgi:hypothetical protein